jgi:hypothetical protein
MNPPKNTCLLPFTIRTDKKEAENATSKANQLLPLINTPNAEI